MSRPLILASGSSARAAVLSAAGLAFTIERPNVDERALEAPLLAAGITPAALAAELADAKAAEVSARFPGALVIGADQTLDLDGARFVKPESMADARAQLLRLRDREHHLHSAVALASGGAVIERFTVSPRLEMRAFSPALLEAYMAAEGAEILHCVGAYRIEGPAIQLFRRVEGDQSSILGLPILPLLERLRALGELSA
ncbi:Maf family protein [Segnochrobactraceae bacterium EtOH-i3]